MVTENDSLETIREHFTHDRYATRAQCSIIEGRAGYAVCEMPITPDHLNANGTVMGGAMFTLADFAMAVAANLDEKPTVAINCNIRFFSPAKGTKLIATCKADKAGRRVGFYTVDIKDDLGTYVAQFNATAHRS